MKYRVLVAWDMPSGIARRWLEGIADNIEQAERYAKEVIDEEYNVISWIEEAQEV
jgi:hypothetical protein